MSPKNTAGRDPVWNRLHEEVLGMAQSEAMLASYLYAAVLSHPSLEASLSYLLAAKLASPYLSAMSLRDVFAQALADSAAIREALRRDLTAVLERDPAARLGKGILIDHGTGVVIGETAVVGDDVSLLHEVTLGGTGKETGDRHPKIGNGVLIGAGAKILGNVRVGNGSKVAAGSVVLHEVPAHATVAGVPARIVGHPATDEPALQMDQCLDADFTI